MYQVPAWFVFYDLCKLWISTKSNNSNVLVRSQTKIQSSQPFSAGLHPGMKLNEHVILSYKTYNHSQNISTQKENTQITNITMEITQYLSFHTFCDIIKSMTKEGYIPHSSDLSTNSVWLTLQWPKPIYMQSLKLQSDIGQFPTIFGSCLTKNQFAQTKSPGQLITMTI